MGDRGNIVLEQTTAGGGTGRIFLYTHWGGSAIEDIVREALKRKERWDDPTYLGHIIFDALEDATGEHGSPTGLGIGLYPSDNEYPYVVVNADEHTVTREREDGAALKVWTFEEFIADGM